MNLFTTRWLIAGAVGALSVIAVLVYKGSPPASSSTKVTAPTSKRSDGDMAVRRVEKLSSPHVGSKQDDWEQEFYKSSDYFSFVSRAAVKGLNGDGRAAYFVSKAVAICAPVKIQYERTADPAAAFQAEWSARANAPKWLLDKAQREFQTCVGMIAKDAFAALPQKPGGYWSSLYWQGEAYAAGDPLAQSVHAGETLSKTQFEKEAGARSASFSSAQLDIDRAIGSKDVSALFQVGQILSDGHYTDSKTQGFVVAIAACEMGYDCSANNAALEPYLGCVPIGTCPPGLNYPDVIKSVVGNNGYADIYAQAQAFEDALSRGDQEVAQGFVRLKPGS